MKSLALLVALALPAAATNVIFMMADDLGYMDVGFNNPSSFYETPNLNALAKQGVRFTAGYAACPVCSPTRSSILTGQYPARTKNTDFFGAPNEYQELPENAAALKTGNFGKQGDSPVLPAPYLGRLAASHVTLAEAFKAKGYATMHAGILGYIEPVTSPLWAFLLIGEQPPWTTLAGGALIIAAGALVIVFGQAESEPLLEPLA